MEVHDLANHHGIIWRGNLMGFDKTFDSLRKDSRQWAGRHSGDRFLDGRKRSIPRLGQEFMPSLNEGSSCSCPPACRIPDRTKLEYIEMLDKRITNIPEVEVTVGKWGRVNSALDPAPTQMFENTINYIPEYILDENASTNIQGGS